MDNIVIPNKEFSTEIHFENFHYYEIEKNLKYFNHINFYESIPGGKPENKNTGKWFLITGNTIITQELTSELEHFHMIEFNNYQLPIENIPKHITHIKISGKQYNHSIHNLPNHIILFHMYVYNEYIFPIENLPNNIKVLCIENKLKHPIHSFPPSLLILVLSKYNNHQHIIDIPPNIIVFASHVHSLQQIRNVPYNMKSFFLLVDIEYELEQNLEPIIFHNGLEYFSLHGSDICPAQIELLPDTIHTMDIQITDDEQKFIKFPKYLTKLHIEENSTMLYNTILPSLTNLQYIEIQLRCIYLIDVETLPPSLTEIYFYLNSMTDGIFFTAKYMKEIIDTNPEFSKYKHTFYKLLYKNNKRSIEDIDNDNDDANSDNEYDEYLEYLYEIRCTEYIKYIMNNKTELDDSLEIAMIKKRIIRKYIQYTLNKITAKGIQISFQV